MELGLGVVACVQAAACTGLSYFSLYLCPKRRIPSSTTAELRKKTSEVTFHSVERQRAGSLPPGFMPHGRAAPKRSGTPSVSPFSSMGPASHNYMPWHLVLHF